MIKLKNKIGLWLKVNDLSSSLKFYESLGFDFKKKEKTRATGHIDQLWIELSESQSYAKYSTSFLYLEVGNIDETYRYLKSRDIKIINTPTNYEGERRELMIEDPDGYKIVIFNKI